MGFLMINNSKLLHWNPGRKKKNLEIRYLKWCQSATNWAPAFWLVQKQWLHKKSHVLTAGHTGALSLSSNGEQHASQNKTQDAVKRHTSCMPRHSISFSLWFSSIWTSQDEQDLPVWWWWWTGTDRNQPIMPSQAGTLLWLICGISFWVCLKVI